MAGRVVAAVAVLAVLALPESASATSQELILDGSFEAGQAGGIWTESSTNFVTPICSIPLCTNGGGTGPRTGTYWAWFGGIDADETATVSQTFTIPVGTATLSFWLEIPACDTDGTDTFAARIDGTAVFSTTNVDPACGLLGYAQKTIDVSAYANGAQHTAELRGTFTSAGSGITNFFVDDVSLTQVSPPPPAPQPQGRDLLLKAKPKRVEKGDKSLTGTLTLCTAGSVIEFQKKKGDAFVSFASVTTGDDCNAKKKVRVKKKTTFGAKAPAETGYLEAASNPVTVKVKPPS